MNWNMENWLRQLRVLIPLLITVSISVLALLAFKYLLPFVLALMVTGVIWPVVKLLERWRVPRIVASILCLSVFFLSAGFAISMLVLQTSQELLGLATAIPDLFGQAEQYSVSLLERMEKISHIVPEVLLPYVDKALNGLATQGVALSKSAASGLLSGIGMMPGFFLILIFGILGSFVITLDLRAGSGRLLQNLSPDVQMKVRAIFREMGDAVGKYLKALVILVGITFVVTLVGLSLIGVEYAIVGSVIIAVSDLLPLLGPGTIFIPWSVWMIITGETTKGLMMLGLYGFIFVFRQAIQPKVLADTMELPALPLLIAIWIGLTQFGLLGLLLAPFVLVLYQAVAKALWVTAEPVIDAGSGQ